MQNLSLSKPSFYHDLTMSSQFVLATFNPNKLKEIQEIWKEEGWDLVSLTSYPDAEAAEETGDTFLENALIKARAAFALTHLPSLADDSGLEVDFLDGDPGVRSARFAGDDVSYQANNEKLLQLMQGVPENERTARFRCVVALIDSEGEAWVEGRCEGRIITELKGTEGFGYDPLFLIPEKGKTFAEMSGVEKHAISHRGIAFRNMAALLKNRL